MPATALLATNQPTPWARVVASGKFFRLGDVNGPKHWLRGVSYGPFRPNSRDEPYPEDELLASDMASIRALGFNTVRLYDLPSEALCREARRQELRLMVGIPWSQHIDFLCTRERHQQIENQVRSAARRLAASEEVIAIFVGNEIEKTLVRWLRPPRVKRFIEHLIDLARAEAPQCLISYANYPSTEYLVPSNADFLACNLYLEDPIAFAAYALRLHHLANSKPLVISEHGADTQRHGAKGQAEMRRWQSRICDQLGIAGQVWFAFTDEWFRGGEEVTSWSFGLVDRDRHLKLETRNSKPASEVLSPSQLIHSGLPLVSDDTSAPANSELGSSTFFSIIICTRNGSATLRACLEAVKRQTYPNYEVLVIDDGSTDSVPDIVRDFPQVRYHRQEASGLSVARNTGAALSNGDILAYTDDDCLPDEDWLSYLLPGFESEEWVAVGGPNLPPEPRTFVERCVAIAPGGPMHVMLNDEEAEHLPGCNLAIRKTALLAIGGFGEQFHTAGDDVDICWRLRDAGGKLRFVPAAMVWHHRRFSVRAYLRQQSGYGFAEAQLMKAHPTRFGLLGGAMWRGAIYGERQSPVDPREGSVFHGPLGDGAFQVIYTGNSQISGLWHWFGGVLWVILALLLLLLGWHLASLSLSTLAVLHAARKARQLAHQSLPLEPQTFLILRLKFLLVWLCLLQPIAREWARLRGMFALQAFPSSQDTPNTLDRSTKPKKLTISLWNYAFWSDAGVGRDELLSVIRQELEQRKQSFSSDGGWRWFDLEFNPESTLSPAISTVTEYHQGTKRLTRVTLQVRLSVKGLTRLATALALVLVLLELIFGPEQTSFFVTAMVASLFVFSLVRLNKCSNLVFMASKLSGIHLVSTNSLNKFN